MKDRRVSIKTIENHELTEKIKESENILMKDRRVLMKDRRVSIKTIENHELTLNANIIFCNSSDYFAKMHNINKIHKDVKKILNIQGVVSIFISPYSIKISKSASFDWFDIIIKARKIIQNTSDAFWSDEVIN